MHAALRVVLSAVVFQIGLACRLTFMPLIGAIAAGNCVAIKPSEVAANSMQVMAKYIPQYLDKNAFPVCLPNRCDCDYDC